MNSTMSACLSSSAFDPAKATGKFFAVLGEKLSPTKKTKAFGESNQAKNNAISSTKGSETNEIEDGIVNALIRTLAGISDDHKKTEAPLNDDRALQMSTLCSALSKMLKCNHKTLGNHMEKLCSSGLVSVLIQVVDFFLYWPGEETIRSVALSRCAYMIYLVCTHNSNIQVDLADPLSNLLMADIGSDIKIDVACATALIAAHTQIKKHNEVDKMIQAMITPMISTLTTAISCSSSEQKFEIIQAMLNVARSGSVARVKMSKRRDTICRFVECFEEPLVAMNALKIAALLLNCKKSTAQLRSSNPSTGLTLLRGLSKIITKEGVAEPCQELTVAILLSVAEDFEWKYHQTSIVIDSLIQATYSDLCEECRTEVAFALCRLATSSQETDEEEAQQRRRRLYPTMIDFIQFPVAYIRLVALYSIESCTGSSIVEARLIMNEPDFNQQIALLLTRGPPKEQSVAITILCNCSQDPKCAEMMCENNLMLTSIIENLTSSENSRDLSSRRRSRSSIEDPRLDKQTQLHQLDIILNVMTIDSNVVLLINHTEILPWLAKFTATEQLDDDFRKQQVVKAVVRLSHCFLTHGVPNRVLV